MFNMRISYSLFCLLILSMVYVSMGQGGCRKRDKKEAAKYTSTTGAKLTSVQCTWICANLGEEWAAVGVQAKSCFCITHPRDAKVGADKCYEMCSDNKPCGSKNSKWFLRPTGVSGVKKKPLPNFPADPSNYKGCYLRDPLVAPIWRSNSPMNRAQCNQRCTGKKYFAIGQLAKSCYCFNKIATPHTGGECYQKCSDGYPCGSKNSKYTIYKNNDNNSSPIPGKKKNKKKKKNPPAKKKTPPPPQKKKTSPPPPPKGPPPIAPVSIDDVPPAERRCNYGCPSPAKGAKCASTGSWVINRNIAAKDLGRLRCDVMIDGRLTSTNGLALDSVAKLTINDCSQDLEAFGVITVHGVTDLPPSTSKLMIVSKCPTGGFTSVKGKGTISDNKVSVQIIPSKGFAISVGKKINTNNPSASVVDDSANSGPGLPAWMIAMIVVAGLVFLLVIVVIIIVIAKRRRNSEIDDGIDSSYSRL